MKTTVPVTAFNLDTLERIDFPSVSRAADHCLVDKTTLRVYLRKDQMCRGWYWCLTEEADQRMERVRSLSRRWKSEGRSKADRCKEPPKLVPLRIDSHTVIYVKPEKATREYAEKYRERLRNNSIKLLKSNL